MNKYIAVISTVVILTGSSLIVNAQTGIFSKDLYFGMQKDSEVSQLQEFLTSEGLYSGPITGNFFSLTLKAMRDYQTREGISPAAGYFGPLTRAKANAGLSIQIDASNAQATSETGTTPISPSVPKTTTDAVSTMQSQLDVLLQQVGLLQQQLQTQQQTQQTVQNLQNQVTQQQQTLQQIQQNTTPPSPSSTPTAPPKPTSTYTGRLYGVAGEEGCTEDDIIRARQYYTENVNTAILCKIFNQQLRGK